MTGQNASRHITWEGFADARDLGGLPAPDGRVSSSGVFIRSADLRFVTGGWRMAEAADVQTIVDPRNDDEIRPHDGKYLTRLARSAQFAAAAPATVSPPAWSGSRSPSTTLQTPGSGSFSIASGSTARRCTSGHSWNGNPDAAAVVTALANAAPGGVVFRCGVGRDRAELVILLLLALADVEPEATAENCKRIGAHSGPTQCKPLRDRLSCPRIPAAPVNSRPDGRAISSGTCFAREGKGP